MRRLLASLAPLCLLAQTPESSAVLRVLGNSHMEKLVTEWERGFRGLHPEVQFRNRYLGTANAIAGLYLETADLALMGRETIPMEDIAYRRVFPDGPLGLTVATASFDVPLETFAFAIFVNRRNPIERLTLRQLQAIFGCEPAAPGCASIQTWGQLGLTGEWSTRPIRLHGYQIDSGLGRFFQQTVLDGSRKWNCAFTEYANLYAPGGRLLANAGDLIVRAVAQDDAAIGFCGYGHATAADKALPLAAAADARYVPLTRENVANRSYPLTRSVYIYANRHPANPMVFEFLRYVLSAQGQRDVTRQDVYLPLPDGFVRNEREKLRD